MYVGHKVTMRGREDSFTGEKYPDREGMVLDVNRDQSGNINNLYVLVVEEDSRGYIYMSPLHELVFHDGPKLQKDVNNPYEQMVSQTLGLMLQSSRPMEV